MENIKNFIDGRWIASGPTFERASPTNGAAFSLTSIADEKMVEQAANAALTALPLWSSFSPRDRAKYLTKCAKWLEQQYGKPSESTTLKRLIVDEVGKPLPEADIEVIETSGFVQYFADQAPAILADKTIQLNRELWPTKRSVVHYKPIGVVGVIKAWNYPLELPLWSIAPALLAGNTVVFKPSEKASAVGAVLGKMAMEIGLPPGVINIVNGGPEVGNLVVHDPRVSMISFTGSVVAGRQVAENCGRLLKKVSLELGGNDAAIVAEDADLELAANGIVWGAFCNAGQVCVGIKRAYIHERIADKLIQRIIEKTSALRLGVDVGPIIDETQLNLVEDFVADAIAKGGRILVGGSRDSDRPGTYFSPTVVANMSPNMKLAREECFGPVLPIAVVKSVDEAVAAANQTDYGLGASVWSSNPDRAFDTSASIAAGMVWINDVNVAFAETPWGGVKRSGIGFELSPEVLLEYSARMHINSDDSSDSRRVWWYPYPS